MTLLFRVRRYCNQVLDKEIDDCCTELLQDLVRFQEQAFNKEPSKVCYVKIELLLWPVASVLAFSIFPLFYILQSS